MGLRSEIFEQPEVLACLLKDRMVDVEAITGAIRGHKVDFVLLAARGTSDNAALYAKYLWGAFNRLPVGMAAPSLFSVYNRPPALKNALVVGISQSGQSPDIVNVISEGRRQGAPTLAITNDPHSPLAMAAKFVIDTSAGSEQAVAATKTYTAQLMAIAMLSVALNEDADRREALQRVPALVEEVLATEEKIEQAAVSYRDMAQCVVLGRGYDYATAFEWSLKLKELAYVVAEPYSPSDFQHGPVAILSAGFPVLAIMPKGAVFPDLLALLSELIDRHKVRLLVLSNDDEALALAERSLRLPSDLPEWLSPIVSVVPAQLFCYHLTRAKGYDPESPRGLTKVTRTW
ncbi:MAG: Glutamine--fructose-6-phosphate aminotransferase (isomerizing) [Firmicutes bacterium]|nr:Glutamine--fructose-6-phosphate aminotransferase (isomerizing) [candidate division NPL-UPA2 bacterium]